MDTYKDASLTVYLSNFPNLGFKVPIIATIESCVVEKLKFETGGIMIDYYIGLGPLLKQFPKIIQSPNCGLTFSQFTIVGVS